MTTASISKANDILARFGQDQVPLIGFCQPSIEAISDEHCEIKISLNTKTQNHVASLYFGTLAVGADITGGFMAMMLAEQSGHYIELLFKDFKADFTQQFWSEKEQEKLRKDIAYTPWNDKMGSMYNHFAYYVSRAKILTEPMPE